MLLLESAVVPYSVSVNFALALIAQARSRVAREQRSSPNEKLIMIIMLEVVNSMWDRASWLEILALDLRGCPALLCKSLVRCPSSSRQEITDLESESREKNSSSDGCNRDLPSSGHSSMYALRTSSESTRPDPENGRADELPNIQAAEAASGETSQRWIPLPS